MTATLACGAFALRFAGVARAEQVEPPLGAAPVDSLSSPPGAHHRLTLRDDGAQRSSSDDVARGRNLAADIPLVAYTTQSFGSEPATLGASAFGDARFARSRSQPLANGGLRIWGSPIDRLVLTLDGQRKEENGKFAPTATAQVRVLGSTRDAWALAVLGRYKTDGFASLEGEVEGGLLFSVGQLGFHFDSNVIAGGDFDGHEADGELLGRAGYDVLPFLRLGAEGRGRYRLAGATPLPGNRNYDAFGGAQILAYADHYFAAATAGPSTVGIADRIGWSAIVNAGGVAF